MFIFTKKLFCTPKLKSPKPNHLSRLPEIHVHSKPGGLKSEVDDSEAGADTDDSGVGADVDAAGPVNFGAKATSKAMESMMTSTMFAVMKQC